MSEMYKRYFTERAIYLVNPKKKIVRWAQAGAGSSGKATYEFFEHRPDGSLYFHAFDPDTGKLRPFTTEPVTHSG